MLSSGLNYKLMTFLIVLCRAHLYQALLSHRPFAQYFFLLDVICANYLA
jgi:hypothetical protein